MAGAPLEHRQAAASQPLPTEAQGRNIALQSIFRERDTIETISPETAEEINRLEFNTVSSPVVAQKLDHIDQSHGQFTQGDVDALRSTIAAPTEILPNLPTEASPGRANSVLMVRQNGGKYISIVEIAPGETGNPIWNFWKIDNKKEADRYLRKFRVDKERRLRPGGTTPNTTQSAASSELSGKPAVSDPSYSSPSNASTSGKPEGLSGSQTATPSSEQNNTPSTEEVKPEPAPSSPATPPAPHHSPRSRRRMVSIASGSGRGRGS
jgi:hypothetical protein